MDACGGKMLNEKVRNSGGAYLSFTKTVKETAQTQEGKHLLGNGSFTGSIVKTTACCPEHNETNRPKHTHQTIW
jgi:hypothetical protein